MSPHVRVRSALRRIRINWSLPKLSSPPHQLLPPMFLPYSQNALGKMSYYNEETQNYDEYNTTRLVHLIRAPLQVWTLAPRRWEYINKLASDGSPAPGIWYWQSLGYMTYAHSSKWTLCQNLHLHFFNPFKVSPKPVFNLCQELNWSLKVPEPKMVQVFA